MSSVLESAIVQPVAHVSAVPIISLYERDLYAWAQTNARLLKERRFEELDIEHLIEEIEDMGRSEQRAVMSHLRNLLIHLLKWQFQPELRSKSWRFSISNARIEIAALLAESPSLRDLPANRLVECYVGARSLAADETGLNGATFPENCPYPIQSVLDQDWLPG